MGLTMQNIEPGVPIPIRGTEIPVKRIVGRNPGPMTGPGTNTYLIGKEKLCLLDPGPVDEKQLSNFLSAINGNKLEYILVTHTHGDHSPAAKALQAETGAELVGLVAPDAIGQDHTFTPSRIWSDGDEIDCDEYQLRLIHTPGHVSNHICYLLVSEGLLFTGDHILQGTTSVILPPDGDMGAYLNSLRSIKALPLRYLAPGHGAVMDKPHEEIDHLIDHRLRRERKVLSGLAKIGRCTINELVLVVYDDVAEHLIPWAKKTMLAHLIKLERDGRIVEHDGFWKTL